MALLSKIVFSALASVAVPGAIALGLIASDRPVERPQTAGEGLDFALLPQAAEDAPLRAYTARDGTRLGFRRWDSARAGAPLVVALHGSGWHGMQFNGLGAALAGQGLADVVAPDLRGHGPAPQRRGDIDYIGQFEDDIAELIARQARPGQRVILLGHSSGGGLAIRFAGDAHGGLISGAILLAPFVQHDAPTQRRSSGGWARVLTRRIAGLSMLNMAGITALNHLTVIQFAFPQSVLNGPLGHTATSAYSFRLNTSYAPRRDWQADIAALPDFLLVAGRDDEAFHADRYQPTFSAITDRGHYQLVDARHLDVVDNPRTFDAIAGFLRAGGI